MRSRLSIIPRLIAQMYEQLERPHRLIDQHFGLGINPEHLFSSSMFDNRRYVPQSFYRPWIDLVKEDEQICPTIKKGKFNVALDVQQFQPEEINVKIVDNYIVVEGKHEEKKDDYGIISRQFVRKYKLPEQCNIEKAVSMLSHDGILTITAPSKPEATENEERIIKIERTQKSKSEVKEPEREKQRIAQSQ